MRDVQKWTALSPCLSSSSLDYRSDSWLSTVILDRVINIEVSQEILPRLRKLKTKYSLTLLGVGVSSSSFESFFSSVFWPILVMLKSTSSSPLCTLAISPFGIGDVVVDDLFSSVGESVTEECEINWDSLSFSVSCVESFDESFLEFWRIVIGISLCVGDTTVWLFELKFVELLSIGSIPFCSCCATITPLQLSSSSSLSTPPFSLVLRLITIIFFCCLGDEPYAILRYPPKAQLSLRYDGVFGDEFVGAGESACESDATEFKVACVISSKGDAVEFVVGWGAVVCAGDGDKEESIVSSLRSVRFDALIDFPPETPLRDDKEGSLPANTECRTWFQYWILFQNVHTTKLNSDKFGWGLKSPKGASFKTINTKAKSCRN